MRTLLIVLTCSLGCSRSVAPTKIGDVGPDIQQIAESYRKLNSMLPHAVSVDPAFAAMCRSVSPEEIQEAAQLNGPHARAYVQIYMNEQAAAAFKQASAQYPAGSVIVKEKASVPEVSDGANPQPAKPSDGVGGMIKRPPGYDPEHGDWEYFYFENANKIESGRISSCVQCHQSAEKTDHVFGNWSHRS
jgi:cytochrome P460